MVTATAAKKTPADTTLKEIAQPCGDRVLVRMDEAPRMTRGGLHLPESEQKKRTCRGTIIAVGPGRHAYPSGEWLEQTFKVGQRVSWVSWSGDVLNIDGEDLLLIKADDIIATLETAAE